MRRAKNPRAERRGSERFELALPLDGHIDVLQPVIIEQAGENDVVVLSTAPGVRGEVINLRIGTGAHATRSVVRVVTSEPCVVDAGLVHRIRLRARDGTRLPVPAEAGNVEGGRTSAVFVRRYPARVVNLSRGGCLVQLPAGLDEGTVATLATDEDEAGGESIRVTHLGQRYGGAWPFVAGSEFLPLDVPSGRSLRTLAGRFEVDYAGDG